MNPEPGIYAGVDEAEYRAWPYAHYSAVKVLALEGTPAHYKAMVDDPPEPSDAMRFGSLCHAAVLTPEALEKMQPLPKEIKARRGKEYDALCAENPGIEYFPPAQWAKKSQAIEEALRVRENVLGHPVAGELLKGAQVEVSVVWDDPETEVRCKMRADALAGHVADLKMTRYTAPYLMARSGYKMGYHIQAAMYTDGLAIALGKDPLTEYLPFWFIMVESQPPHLVCILNGHAAYHQGSIDSFPDAYLRIGREQYHSALRTIKSCTVTGQWEGHSLEPQSMEIPKWAGMEFIQSQPATGPTL